MSIHSFTIRKCRIEYLLTENDRDNDAVQRDSFTEDDRNQIQRPNARNTDCSAHQARANQQNSPVQHGQTDRQTDRQTDNNTNAFSTSKSIPQIDSSSSFHVSRQTDTHAYHEAPTTDMPIHRKDPIDVNVYLHKHTYSSIYTHTHTKQSNQSQCLVSCLFTFLSPTERPNHVSTLYTLFPFFKHSIPTNHLSRAFIIVSLHFMYILSLYCV